jgi:VanZ family protein
MSIKTNLNRVGRVQALMRWIPALAIAIIIFYFSAMPGDEVQNSYQSLEITFQATTQEATLQATAPVAVPTNSPPVAEAFPGSSLDWLKVGHAIGYFGLGIAVLYGLSMRWRWSPSLALILCCLYAFSDEFHQLFTPGRTASARDILIDTLAAFRGVAVMLGLIASKRFFKRDNGT